MTRPKISIIVPVYNTERYLSRCIDSILGQSFKDFELLLIDDGSKDGSGAICDEYAEKDKRVSVWHQENGGPGYTRNMGLDRAIGEHICFIDSDDYWEEGLLAHYMAKSSKADLTYCSFRYIEEGKEDVLEHFDNEIISGRTSIEEYIQPIRYRSYQSCIVDVPWGKFYNKNIIEKYHIRFPEDINFKEDEIFNYRYLKHAQVLEVCDFVGYNYRLLSNSLARRDFSNELMYNLAQHWIEEADNFGMRLKTDIFQRACEYMMRAIYKCPSIKKKHQIAHQILTINAQHPLRIQHIARVAAKFGVPVGSVALVGLSILGNIKRKIKWGLYYDKIGTCT